MVEMIGRLNLGRIIVDYKNIREPTPRVVGDVQTWKPSDVVREGGTFRVSSGPQICSRTTHQ